MLPRIRRFFDVRPGEGMRVLLSFLYVAVVVAAFLLARPIRNSLFLEQYGPYALVYVYAAVPLVLSLFVPVYTRIAARLGSRVMTVGTLVFFSSNALLFWHGFRAHPGAGTKPGSVRLPPAGHVLRVGELLRCDRAGPGVDVRQHPFRHPAGTSPVRTGRRGSVTRCRHRRTAGARPRAARRRDGQPDAGSRGADPCRRRHRGVCRSAVAPGRADDAPDATETSILGQHRPDRPFSVSAPARGAGVSRRHHRRSGPPSS